MKPSILPRRNLYILLPLVVVSFFSATGCEDAAITPPDGPNPHVVVTGEVTRIVDGIPVDGGVTVDVDVSNDVSEVLYLPSFAWGQPTANEEKAYQVILTLEIGDWVTAQGTRTASGIKLEGLRVAAPQARRR